MGCLGNSCYAPIGNKSKKDKDKEKSCFGCLCCEEIETKPKRDIKTPKNKKKK